MAKCQPGLTRFALITTDAVVTLGIFLLLVSLLNFAFTYVPFALFSSNPEPPLFAERLRRAVSGTAGPFWSGFRFWRGDEGSEYGIYLYTTFVSSVWVWLYAAGGLAVRTCALFGVGLDRFRRLLDIKNHPLRSIGFVCNVGVTGACAVRC